MRLEIIIQWAMPCRTSYIKIRLSPFSSGKPLGILDKRVIKLPVI